MMMEWMGQTEKAKRIEAAVQWALDNEIKTPDLGGRCRTEEVTNALAKYLEKS
jgi:isocitrate/isopropylmalate dehydrogenase